MDGNEESFEQAMTVGSGKGTFEKYHLKVLFKQAKELYTAKHADIARSCGN